MEHSVNHLFVSLQAEITSNQVALCAALDIAGDATEAPEWVHLLSNGEMRTGDSRGPYRIRDGNAQAVIAHSLQSANDRLVLDENHSTDLQAPKGLPAPARGWIVALESRADGVWGKVEWTEEGRRMVANREYRGISPVILHDKAGNIDAILRASLVNKPNLKGLVTLHSETSSMDLLAQLIAALKLPIDTSAETLVTAITTMHAQQGQHQVALQAQVDPVAEAVGLPRGAKLADVVAAIKQLAAADTDGATIVALQAEMKTMGETILSLQADGTKKTAQEFVDKAILDGRVGVKPMRDRYITMHMADPANTEAIINALPAIGGRMNLSTVPAGGKDAGGKRVLTAEQENTIALMQLDRDAYIATLDKQEQAATAL